MEEVGRAAVDQVGRPAVGQDGRRRESLVVQLLQHGGRPRRRPHRRVRHPERGAARPRGGRRRARSSWWPGRPHWPQALQLCLDAPQCLDVLRAPLWPEAAAAAQSLVLVLEPLPLGLIVQGVLKGKRER